MTRLILILALASLACVAPATMIQPVPTAAPTPTPAPTEILEQTFTVTAWTLYIRSASGERIDYLERGDTIQCVQAGEWCILDDDTRVWAGCIEPNPLNLGCRER